MLDTLRQDIRYAARQLGRAPLFTAAAAISLAMGIAVSVTVLSVVNSVLFKPLPIRDPDGLYRITTSDRERQRDYAQSSYDDLEDFNSTGAFSEIAGISGGVSKVFANAHPPEYQAIQTVSPNFFQVIGIQPRPRGFSTSGLQPEIVISERYRRRIFKDGENPIGSTVLLGKVSYTIVGIAPSSYHDLYPFSNVSIWAVEPVWRALNPRTNPVGTAPERSDRATLFVGRLNPGITQQAAEQRLNTVAAQLAKRYPKAWLDIDGKPLHASVLTPHQMTMSLLGDDMPIMLGTVAALIAFVLILGCTNVAGLLLARAVTRRQEIAVRLTLGASRTRIIAQLLTEALMLAFIGGALGLFLAEAAIRIAGTSPMFEQFTLTPDWRIFGATALVCALCAALFGITPTMHALRVDLKSGLTGQGVVGERGGVRGRLMALQVCLAFLLIVLGSSASRGIRSQVMSSPSINTSGLVIVPVPFSGVDTIAWRRDLNTITEQMRSIDGVYRVIHAQRIPLQNYFWSTNISVGDRTVGTGYELVDTAYFSALGIHALRGRIPRAGDAIDGRSAVVVDRTLVNAAGHDLLGGTIRIADDHEALVVGIIESVQHRAVENKPVPMLYEVRKGDLPLKDRRFLIARVAPGREVKTIAEFTRRYREHFPERIVPKTEALQTMMKEQLAPQLYISRIAFGVGAAELLLAAIGLYSLLLYATLTRTREIGLRMALGARPARASFTVMLDGLIYVCAGAIMGLAVAIPAAMYAAPLFSGGNAKDPVPMVAAFIGIAIATLGSTLAPARKAALVQPMEALRHE